MNVHAWTADSTASVRWERQPCTFITDPVLTVHLTVATNVEGART